MLECCIISTFCGTKLYPKTSHSILTSLWRKLLHEKCHGEWCKKKKHCEIRLSENRGNRNGHSKVMFLNIRFFWICITVMVFKSSPRRRLGFQADIDYWRRGCQAPHEYGVRSCSLGGMVLIFPQGECHTGNFAIQNERGKTRGRPAGGTSNPQRRHAAPI